MASEAPPRPLLPNFVSSFESPTPYFYFFHTIDPDGATIRVEVIGPNLTFTFSHSRMIRHFSRSERSPLLEKKAVGFLAIVRDSDRHILKWAESGNGAGKSGDLLDVPPKGPVLPNLIWTRRVVRVATLLGIKMTTPFDAMGRKSAKEENKGVFKACHVEVKLAVFAVCLMLRTFGITKDFSKIRRRHLRQLRHVHWQDGTRPEFEIYFSRKNCQTCGKLARALSEITGICIALEWRDRLTKLVYTQTKTRVNGNLRAEPRTITIDDDNEIVDLNGPIVIEDDSDDSTDTIFIDDASEGDDPPVNLVSSEGTRSPGVEETSEVPEIQRFIQLMTEYTDKVDSSPAAPRRTFTTREASAQGERNVKKPIPATPVEADEFLEFDFVGESQRWTKTNSSSAPSTPSSEASGMNLSPDRMTSNTPAETPKQVVAQLQERIPQQYRLTSQNGQLLTPISPNESPLDAGEKSHTMMTDPGDTPSKPPAKKYRAGVFRVEIPMRETLRSPSPFDF